MYTYSAAFQILATSSASAAERIVQILGTVLPTTSVVDIGCARGSWLRAWQNAGCSDILGVDGPYIDKSALEIPPDRFVTADLEQTIDLGRSFDLAECMEVAEHLPQARAESFVADLVRLAPAVLFSAATPGQGGEHHVNEQPAAYWRTIFRGHGYVPVDCLRPLLARHTDIPYWYRYNLILYMREDRLDQLSPLSRLFTVRDGEALADFSPWTYRLRTRVVRSLPAWICDHLSR